MTLVCSNSDNILANRPLRALALVYMIPLGATAKKTLSADNLRTLPKVTSYMFL